ncbi:hypothetical protein X975_08351, partial [Stegodyphus mimosarum]
MALDAVILSFMDGEFIKRSAVTCHLHSDNNLAKNFETVSLSDQTKRRRINEMGSEVSGTIKNILEKCGPYFLNECIDIADINRLLIFVKQ